MANLVMWIAFAASAITIVVYLLGIISKDKRMFDLGKWGTIVTAGAIILASIFLSYIILTDQFVFDYVYSYSSIELPVLLKISAFWAGKSGSLLFWTLMLAIIVIPLALSKRVRENNYVQYVLPIILANIFFFMFLLVIIDSPFALNEINPQTGLPFDPADGAGMNPILQNFWMALHPVTLLLGYALLIVPFAFGIAAMIKRDTSDTWLRLVRKWTLWGWLMLTLGNVMGAKWAYVELSFGGYWAWDPVENASLMPWFTATALLHTAFVQERKNMFKMWNVSLAFVSYLLTIFGTFLVRSGVITSVHSFGADSIGWYFLGFMALITIFSLYFMISRSFLVGRSQEQLTSLFTKEASILWANLFFVLATLVVFFGTIYPILTNFFTGREQTVGESFYNMLTAPVLLAMMILLAFTPIVSWHVKSGAGVNFKKYYPAMAGGLATAILVVALGIYKPYAIIGYAVVGIIFTVYIQDLIVTTLKRSRATDENFVKAFWTLTNKNRRRYGGYLVHIGMALIMIGLVGSQNYKEEKIVTLQAGERMDINNYTVAFESLNSERVTARKGIDYAVLSVFKDGKSLGTIKPEMRYHFRMTATGEEEIYTTTTKVIVLSTLKEDLYVVIRGIDEDGVTFMIDVMQMVSWLWIGTIVATFGAMFALWTPAPRGNRVIAQTEDFENELEMEDEELIDIEAEIAVEIEKAKQRGKDS